MTGTDLKRFLVLYFIPAAVIDRWMLVDAAERQAREGELRAEWGAWMQVNGGMIVSTEAAGKTKRVTATGLADARNDIIIHCIVQAATHDAAAAIFVGHPHLQIPEASIEIVELRAMG